MASATMQKWSTMHMASRLPNIPQDSQDSPRFPKISLYSPRFPKIPQDSPSMSPRFPKIPLSELYAEPSGGPGPPGPPCFLFLFPPPAPSRLPDPPLTERLKTLAPRATRIVRCTDSMERSRAIALRSGQSCPVSWSVDGHENVS